MKKMMKKGFDKILSMLLVVSMLAGFGGCMSLLNMSDSGNEPSLSQEQQLQDETKDSYAEDGNRRENPLNSATKEEQKNEDNPENRDEEFLSESFTEKMEVLEYLVDLYYMNPVSVEDMRIGAYKGMLEGLGDPYSCYYTAEEYQTLMESTSGIYCGIGAVVQQNTKTMLITIVKPYVDGPAYNAGMLPGDIVYMVDGVDVSGMDMDTVVSMMKGDAGTVVEVTVVRDGVADPVVLTITRDFIEIETVEYEMLDHNIGLIRVSGFDEPTSKQFKDAVETLKAEGMEALIIDLRDNGGGLLTTVVDMLDYILPEGMIVYTEDRNGNREEFKGTDKEVLDMPMAVMINGNSASASEIFAAAMQDYEAATLVGTTSFGKGIVQSIIPLSDGTAVKLTVSRYFTPNGVCIHGTGVTPDVEVDLADELKQLVVIPTEDDNQLAVAVAILLSEIVKK